MHFSSPSGQRLRMCRPWYRGAGGLRTSGYSSVTTFLNMCEKVTPNPLRVPPKDMSALLAGWHRFALGDHAGRAWARRHLEVQWWQREALGATDPAARVDRR